MDKYAVDLDQVLNDFEYSELTDHFNSDQLRIPKNGNIQNNSEPSFHQNNPAKHSITNVFNSLTEYLNTDITPKYNSQIHQENTITGTQNKNIYFEVSDQFDNERSSVEVTSEVEASDNNSSIINVNALNNTTLPSLENEHTEEVVENTVDEEEISGDSTDNKSETPLINVNTESDETEAKIICSETEETNDDNFMSADEESGSDKNVQKTDDIFDSIEDVEVNKQLSETVLDTQKAADVEEIVDSDSESCNNQIVPSNDTESIHDDPTDVEVEETNTVCINENGVKDTICNIQETELNSVQIGFVDDLNLDDSEINRAFEELEQELESHISINDCVSQSELENYSKVTGEIVDNQVVESEMVEECKNNNNEVLCETDVDIEIGDNVNRNHCDKEKEDSFVRPQDLAVNNGSDKREINLIGDPGSTPYNNVYINKEMSENKSKTNDSDTEYSTSDSPTFSDESSECGTASTASTEAVNDEHDKDKIPEVSVTHQAEENRENLEEITTDQANNEENADNSNDIVVEADVGAENIVEEENAEALPEDARANVTDLGVVDVNLLSMGQDKWLGKQAPLWIPDSDALSCLHCDMKFTVLKRRHHCRACGLVLCSKCCNLRFRLDYLEQEARVCKKCFNILNNKDAMSSSSGSEMSPDIGNSPTHRPNPNNPLEYCSTVSPLQQVDPANQNPPSVMVPVGVLKREGSTKTRTNKSVIFCDGIRPGSDLTNLDTDFNYNYNKALQKGAKRAVVNKNLPNIDSETKSFIPSTDNCLPPTISIFKTDVTYSECPNDLNTIELLKNDTLSFAIHLNMHIHLRIINMDCCVNKVAWCFSTEGLINVGQDEIVILLEFIEGESTVPKDVLLHLNNIYFEAVKGTSVKETGVSLHNSSILLDSKNHAGFVYIRPTFECLRKVILPKESFLIGILIHRWETPWAKLFPLRLILRLGAEYRYYPSPIISTRFRDSVFVEIGHTIINLLADFRNFSYTLPQIRGLTIHMEDKKTTINIPVNRYDQVMKSISNSSDHILAFAGNFSMQADSHLVCIQDTQGNENNYSTHAINIHNKPRNVTGASFIVFNGALKSSSGLTAKSNIVEDGLMIQVLPENMLQIRESLRNMKNHTIQCGCVNVTSDETVHIVWGENDVNFNIGVMSPIDNKPMSGIPSIRVHNGKDYICNSKNRLIRWTEVFIIQNGEESNKNQDPVDISKVSESIAKAACNALVKYLDLLVSNNFYKIAIRTTLHIENVSYSAGSNNMKLPPIYMKSLDNELIPVLHRITSNNFGDNAIVLELILRILNM